MYEYSYIAQTRMWSELQSTNSSKVTTSGDERRGKQEPATRKESKKAGLTQEEGRNLNLRKLSTDTAHLLPPKEPREAAFTPRAAHHPSAGPLPLFTRRRCRSNPARPRKLSLDSSPPLLLLLLLLCQAADSFRLAHLA